MKRSIKVLVKAGVAKTGVIVRWEQFDGESL